MTWSLDATLSLDVMFAECQGDTEWLVWALIKLLAVSTAASDASTSGCAEVRPISQVTGSLKGASSAWDGSGAVVRVPLTPR